MVEKPHRRFYLLFFFFFLLEDLLYTYTYTPSPSLTYFSSLCSSLEYILTVRYCESRSHFFLYLFTRLGHKIPLLIHILSRSLIHPFSLYLTKQYIFILNVFLLYKMSLLRLFLVFFCA
jgi:hypothetical protein